VQSLIWHKISKTVASACSLTGKLRLFVYFLEIFSGVWESAPYLSGSGTYKMRSAKHRRCENAKLTAYKKQDVNFFILFNLKKMGMVPFMLCPSAQMKNKVAVMLIPNHSHTPNMA